MKRTLIILLSMTLVFGLATAEAGQRGKKTRKAPDKGLRTEMPDTWKTARYDNLPTMSYAAGTIQQNGLRGWRLGELDLILKKDCVIVADGAEEGFLQPGRNAVVMGSRAGDTMVAWSVRILPHDYSNPTTSPFFTRHPGPNPNVGVLKGRVE